MRTGCFVSRNSIYLEGHELIVGSELKVDPTLFRPYSLTVREDGDGFIFVTAARETAQIPEGVIDGTSGNLLEVLVRLQVLVSGTQPFHFQLHFPPQLRSTITELLTARLGVQYITVQQTDDPERLLIQTLLRRSQGAAEQARPICLHFQQPPSQKQLVTLETVLQSKAQFYSGVMRAKVALEGVQIILVSPEPMQRLFQLRVSSLNEVQPSQLAPSDPLQQNALILTDLREIQQIGIDVVQLAPVARYMTERHLELLKEYAKKYKPVIKQTQKEKTQAFIAQNRGRILEKRALLELLAGAFGLDKAEKTFAALSATGALVHKGKQRYQVR